MTIMTRLAKNILISLISLSFSLVLAELGLRMLGDAPGPKPVAYEPDKFSCKEPFKEDINAGWSLKPGSYSIRQEGREEPVSININNDGSRRTSYQPVSSNRQIILVGDSYIFGHGLNDNETLGWLLQAHLSNATVINHGVGGYGTCQVLIKVRELAPYIKPGAKIIYGFSSFHAARNVADPRSDYWIAMTSPDHSSQYPYCKLRRVGEGKEFSQDSEKGEIMILPAKIWHPIIPFTGYLSLSRRLTNTYLTLLADKEKDQRDVSIGIIRDLQGVIKEKESELVVLLQDVEAVDRPYYSEELAKLGIRTIDGTIEKTAVSLRLSDGHPGPKVNIIWARMVEEVLGGSINDS